MTLRFWIFLVAVAGIASMVFADGRGGWTVMGIVLLLVSGAAWFFNRNDA